MMPERHIALEGCLNLRDIGGYVTADGHQVRRGCLYRSGELCSLTDEDVDEVARLGIRVVFDLRNEWERTARASRLPPGVELLERTSPSWSDRPSPSLEEQIASGDLPVRDNEAWIRIYVDILDRLAAETKLILERAVDAPRLPLLFHCAAGKDRTGLVAALLLGLLRVPHETIIEDYGLTTTYYTARRLDALADVLAEHKVAPDTVRAAIDARAEVLDGALRHLLQQWGTYDGYATECLGVAARLPEQLRAALTEPVESP